MYTLNEIKTLPLCDVIIRPWKSFLIKIIKRVDRIYEVIVCNHWKRDITELWLSNTSIHWLLPGGVPLPQQREERINTAYSISAKEIKLWFIIVELKITEEQLLFWKGGDWKKKKTSNLMRIIWMVNDLQNSYTKSYLTSYLPKETLVCSCRVEDIYRCSSRTMVY